MSELLNLYEVLCVVKARLVSNLVADPEPESSTVSAFYWENTAAIDPATGLPAICTANGGSDISYTVENSIKLCQAHEPSPSGRYDSDSTIALQIVPSPSQQGCKPLAKHAIPTGDDCYKNFMNVNSSYMSTDGGGKDGVWKETSADGCWDWWMWGRELPAGVPLS